MPRRRARSLVAAAALAAVAAIVPTSPAAAATATHVGIVVSNGSSTVTNCVSAGGTGLKLLMSKFSTLIPSSGPYAGFVVRIDGVGKNPPDTTHYWSYWHSSGNGTWTYSNAGAGSYTPKPGTVEGWSYVNGRQDAPKPRTYTYAALCGGADPKPRPKHTATPTHTAGRTHATARPVTPAVTGDATTTTATAHAPTKPAPRTTRTTAAGHPPATVPATTPPQSAASNALAASPTTSPVAHRQTGRPSGRGLPAWGTIVAVAVVLALGSAAWLRLRHRPE